MKSKTTAPIVKPIKVPSGYLHPPPLYDALPKHEVFLFFNCSSQWDS